MEQTAEAVDTALTVHDLVFFGGIKTTGRGLVKYGAREALEAAVENADHVAADAATNASRAAAKLPRFHGPKPGYAVNPAHVPGRGLRPGKTPLPNDAENVFKNAVPNDAKSPTAWFGRNSDGQIYRYSLGGDGSAHFSGIHGVGDGTRNITRYALDRLDGL